MPRDISSPGQALTSPTSRQGTASAVPLGLGVMTLPLCRRLERSPGLPGRSGSVGMVAFISRKTRFAASLKCGTALPLTAVWNGALVLS